MSKPIESGMLGATNGCGGWHPALLSLAWLLGCCVTTLAAAPIRSTVTDGLIHYWPDLWDAHDEVSGQQGFVMGILPPVEAGAREDTPFNDETGWVQLPVNIPAERALTVSVWIKTAPAPRGDGVALAFHSRGQHWWLSNSGPGDPGTHRLGTVGLDAREGPELILSRESWHHLAFTKSATGEATLWKDGIAQAADELSVASGAELEWITAGNDLKGDAQWFGRLQDLSVFDRVLSEQELRDLHAAERSSDPSRNSAARRTALNRSEEFSWSTNVVRRSIDQFIRRRYTAEDGLPANNVQAVVQTRDGYLWVGTAMGLARYDGQRFRTFTEHNTAALAEVGADVLCLAEAPDGNLWAAAYGGLLRIRGTQITGYTAGLPERFLLQVAPAEDGAVWIAGFRLDRNYRGPCRVRRYHPETGHTSAEVSVPGHVRRLVPTPDGVWMATEEPEQLLFWDLKSPTPTVVAKFTGQPLKVGLRATAVVPGGVRMRGWQDPQDPLKEIIEIGVDHHELTFHWLTPRLRSGISASRWINIQNPDFWIGAEPGLVRILCDRLEQIHFDEQTQQPEITCLGSNREGGVWVGTYSDGLQLIRERLVQVYTTRDGLGGNDIRSVVATREGTVLAGGPAGLDELRGDQWIRRGTGTPTPLSAVKSVAQDAFGTVWFGHGHIGQDALRYLAGDSALAFDRSRFEWAHPSSLAVTPEGRLWAACNRGITALDLHGIAPSSASSADHPGWMHKIVHNRIEAGGVLPRVEFLKLLPDRDGSLWVGTFGKGLLRIKDDQVESFAVEDGLPSNVCSPAHLDETGALWVVAKGAVARRQKGRFQSLGPREGIPDDQFLDLIADDLGHFWLPGLRGIHRLDRSQLEACFDDRLDRVQSLTLGMRDGLLTPDCTSLHYPITAKTGDGRIWVATRNGVASFDPSRIEVDIQPMAASIEQIIINRAPIIDPIASPSGPPLKFAPGSGERVEFHYTATSLVAADRIRFRHRLDGYDSDWSPESDLRLAFYTNLRPGKYQFRVQASNAYGTWNETATPLPFVIVPHFWQTRLFQWATGLLVLAIALLLHRHRLGVLRYLQELRHQQQLSGERTRIAADMHDDLGAALSQISILSEVAKKQSSFQPQAHSALDRISQSAREVTSRMSDLVWATNPRNDTLDNLAFYLREQVARQLETSGVQIRLDFPEEPPTHPVSATFRRNVVMVVKEALNNALKHAGATEIAVELTLEPGVLVLRLADNGRGFDTAASSRRGNGLGNMQRRLADIGGTFELHSKPGQGTHIVLKFPLAARPCSG